MTNILLTSQPYGAVTAGGLAGVVSSLGYRVVGGNLYQRLGIHDTCGVLTTGPGSI